MPLAGGTAQSQGVSCGAAKVEEGKPSQPAILALFRASHLHIFDGPTIHEDTFALALSGLGGPDQLLAFSDR
jgi:hypothetical protein